MARTTRRRTHQQAKRCMSGGLAFLPPDVQLTLTVYLRRRRPGSAIDLAELTKRVTPAELEAERRRILKHPVEQVRRFAERQGMRVLNVDLQRRCLTLSTKASDAERTF